MRTKPMPEAFAYGIDIGKKVFHVVAVSRDGAVIQRAKFARETLQSFFDLAPRVHLFAAETGRRLGAREAAAQMALA